MATVGLRQACPKPSAQARPPAGLCPDVRRQTKPRTGNGQGQVEPPGLLLSLAARRSADRPWLGLADEGRKVGQAPGQPARPASASMMALTYRLSWLPSAS